MYVLRIKAADLFKAKKDLDESKKTNARYQEMIEEFKENITDLNSQAEVLRGKIS